MGKRAKKKPKSEIREIIQTVCAIVGTLTALIGLILDFLKG